MMQPQHLQRQHGGWCVPPGLHCGSRLQAVVCHLHKAQLWEAIQADIPQGLHGKKEQILDKLVEVVEKEAGQEKVQRLSLPPGKCWLAGVGPGSKDHVTLRVLQLLRSAQVVVYDDLGAQELLDAAPPSAELLYVGKRGGQPSIKQGEIDQLLVALCRQGKAVVRLKGGCPSTFSRVSSEAAALSAAGLRYELVPGVSTATAAAVLAGFPLTDAQLAGAYAVLSVHDPASIDWWAFSRVPTLVLLMGGRALPAIVTQLQATGWSSSTPVAVVKAAGTDEQRVWFSSLANAVEDTAAGAPLSPCVIVIGGVSSLPSSWQQQQQQQ